jgi:hypothetical protein
MASVRADYTTHGVPAFFEGTQLPVSYSLSIEFKEIEYMLSNDWKDTSFPEGTVTENKGFLGSNILSVGAAINSVAGNIGGGAILVGGAAAVTSVSAGAALTVGGTVDALVAEPINALLNAFGNG